MELKTVVALVGIAALSYLFLPGALAVGAETMFGVFLKGGLATLGAVVGLTATYLSHGVLAKANTTT